MIPIISHGTAGEHGYSYEQFEQCFLEICESHRDERRALAFALILHDLSSPHVSKTLNDPDYWNALDHISGNYLSVFSFHTKVPPRRTNTKEGVFYQMSSVLLDEYSDGRGLIEKYFDLKEQIKLPAILFFQVSNDEIIGSRLVQLKKETIEESFIEIKEIIKSAAEAVSRVTKENHRNDYVIFQLIEDKLRDRGIRVAASAIVSKAKSVREILGLLGF